MRVSVSVALAALAIAAPVEARRFDKVVAFGDSYADIGNVREILNGAGLSALYPEAEYPTGRFSGGTNFVDTIAAAYGVSQDNYAIGGAQAGTGNVAAQGQLPGFRQQWIAFTQGGTTYTDLATSVPIAVSGVRATIPAGGLRFGADDLVVFSVGGNDARPYRRNGTLAGAVGAADAAAAQATEGLDALVARGIRHMVFTAGDVGRLAEAVGQANAPVGTAFSAEYNARMQVALARYASAGVQVAYVDITRIADAVDARPGRLGFVDTTSACPQACIGDPALQAHYFFYVDGVHLTSAAFALVGAYAVNQIDASYGLRAGGDLPRRAAEGFGQALSARLDMGRGTSGERQLALFGHFTAERDRFHADATSDGYRYASKGGIGGVEYRDGRLLLGAAFAYARGHTDGAGGDRTSARSYQVGGYAAIDDGRGFAQAYAGLGWHDVGLRRDGVVGGPLTASPAARSLAAGGRAGWLPRVATFRAGPTLAIDYARARLGGYAEAGDPAAALAVEAQRSDAIVGSAGLEARYAGIRGVAPWLRIEAAKALDGDGRTVRYAPVIAETIVNGFEIGGTSRAAFGRVAGGLAFAISHHVSIDANGRATFGRTAGNQASALVGVRIGL
jgi:phospholipase/lecithinase/hemolysin/uncharacterized protein YhjY with autotransporter beta-barrel domain